MSKGIGKLDPFDITGRRKKRAVNAANEAAATAKAELAAKEAADKEAADKASAEEAAKAKALDEDKAKSAARQAGINGISDALEEEGSTTGKRRFLTGAK
jgi:nucleoid-associated protein YgaU